MKKLDPIVEWIHRLWVKTGWTQAELARKAKVDPNKICEAFNGDRGMKTETASRLLAALGHKF